ncbi:uncharacterized protein DUF4197 [Thermoflavifilum aggregans]|uniref:Uncharacterized protein DUF4197 n=2 Tax=Thermoflavifilum aggregans TaxID=454188 RepID=A0A2M9CVY0_9BACT|nr:uncharacterized protein DUF4197 [Thermoflavifilum aggregans]
MPGKPMISLKYSWTFILLAWSLTGRAQVISQQQAGDALKEALSAGTQQATARLAALNGYYGNPLIRILMPDEAKPVVNALQRVGLGYMVDSAVLAMNRAAEHAATKAAPIFLNAIKHLQLQDALQILKGSDTAATAYLRKTTYTDLKRAFQPVIDSSLQQTGATSWWEKMFTAYNKIPFTRKINPNLSEYVTDKALQGLFLTIGQEEKNIRAHPEQQASALIRNIFGAVSSGR